MNKMTASCIVLVLLSFGILSAQENSKLDVLQRFYDAQKITPVNGQFSQHLTQQITMYKDDGSVSETACEVYTIDLYTSMAVIRSNNDAPQLFLKNKAGSWLYKKGLRGPLRISSSFNVVGAANLADVLGLRLLQDYKVIPETADDTAALLTVSSLYLQAVLPELPYQFIRVLYSEKQDSLAGLELQGLSKKIIKKVTFKDYHVLNNGGTFPTWIIQDVLYGKNQAQTEIRMISINSHSIPSVLFQPTVQSFDRFLGLVQ